MTTASPPCCPPDALPALEFEYKPKGEHMELPAVEDQSIVAMKLYVVGATSTMDTWQGRGPVLEEADLQGHLQDGRLRARVFQDPGVSRPARMMFPQPGRRLALVSMLSMFLLSSCCMMPGRWKSAPPKVSSAETAATFASSS